MNEHEEQTVTVSISTVKFMLERAIDYYNGAVKDGLQNSADFWDGYIKGIRNLIKVAEESNGQEV